MPYLNTNKRPAGTFQRSPFWRLRSRFRELGFFDGEVASAAGIAQATFCRRMSGRQPWTSAEIAAVCRALNIDPEEIGELFFPELNSTNENAPTD